MNAMAEQRFRCVSLDGKSFELAAKFGIPFVEPNDGPGGSHAVVSMSFEPLLPERRCYGENEFQALCLALEFLRSTLKSFAGKGGQSYDEDGVLPVNLDSPWFGPHATRCKGWL
jgi:hypothetical protein